MSSRTPQELAPRIWDAWRALQSKMLTYSADAEGLLDALIGELLQSVKTVPSPAAAEDDKCPMSRAEMIEALASCYHLSGADPDSNEDWRLAPDAVREVSRLRDDYDEAPTPEDVAGLVAALEEIEAKAEFASRVQGGFSSKSGVHYKVWSLARAALAAHRNANARGEEDAD